MPQADHSGGQSLRLKKLGADAYQAWHLRTLARALAGEAFSTRTFPAHATFVPSSRPWVWFVAPAAGHVRDYPPRQRRKDYLGKY